MVEPHHPHFPVNSLFPGHITLPWPVTPTAWRWQVNQGMHLFHFAASMLSGKIPPLRIVIRGMYWRYHQRSALGGGRYAPFEVLLGQPFFAVTNYSEISTTNRNHEPCLVHPENGNIYVFPTAPQVCKVPHVKLENLGSNSAMNFHQSTVQQLQQPPALFTYIATTSPISQNYQPIPLPLELSNPCAWCYPQKTHLAHWKIK